MRRDLLWLGLECRMELPVDGKALEDTDVVS
jgi:hypothetical protein